MRKKFLLIILLLPVLLTAQTEKKQDIWESMKLFVGKWEGKGEGKSGVSKVTKDFQFVLNEKFLQLKTNAVFEPQEKNPKGEVHEDWGFFSFDQSRKKFVFRQFHVEAFIIQYILEEISNEGKTIVLKSEHIENGPPGLEAKLIYKFIDDDTLEEGFYLGFAGKDLDCYITNLLKRKK